MFAIDKLGNIKLTRGDSMSLSVSLERDGAEYELDPSDVVTFSMKESYDDALPVLSKTLSDGELTLVPTDTSGLDIGTYYYNMRITYADGTVDTFIAERTFEVGPNA